MSVGVGVGEKRVGWGRGGQTNAVWVRAANERGVGAGIKRGVGAGI